MKKIILGLASIALTASMVSCDSFLEEEPKLSMSTDQNFATPAHAKAAVNGLYRVGTNARTGL